MRSVFGVKTMDAYQLIATMVRRNHKITEHSESKLVFDLEAVKRIDFKTMTQERVLEIFKDEVTLARYVKGENLTEEEKGIVRRARNAENHHLPKNANVQEYKYATAFESLIGYLYLTKQFKRLKEILDLAV